MLPKRSTSTNVKPIISGLLLREMPGFDGTTGGAEDEMLGTSGEVDGDDAASVALSGSGVGVLAFVSEENGLAGAVASMLESELWSLLSTCSSLLESDEEATPSVLPELDLESVDIIVWSLLASGVGVVSSEGVIAILRISAPRWPPS